VNSASNRRESLTQRCDFMREVIDKVSGLDQESILAKLGSAERDRLSNSRMLSRLTMRRARNILPKGLFSQSVDDREATIIEGGSEIIELLTVTVGAHVLWEQVIRLVQRTDREALNADLGIRSCQIALRGRQHNLGSVSSRHDSADDATNRLTLAERIREEGALSWACWLAARDPISARRLRVFTPERVSKFIVGGLPGTAEERDRRRSVVDLELDELMRVTAGDLAEQEVA